MDMIVVCLCRRYRRGLRARGRRPSVPRNDAGARLEESALTLHPRENPPDRIRRRAAERREKRGLQVETFNFLGFYLDLRQVATWQVPAMAEIPARSGCRQEKYVAVKCGGGYQPVPRTGEVAAREVGQRVVQLSRGADPSCSQTFADCVVRLWLRSLRRRGQPGIRRRGSGSSGWQMTFCRSRASFIPGLSNTSPSNTPKGGSRMRESRSCGSVRGARSNARPYRDLINRLWYHPGFHHTRRTPLLPGERRRPRRSPWSLFQPVRVANAQLSCQVAVAE